MVKNLPSKAGDAGLVFSQGTKIPHVTEQLSWHAATAELHALYPVLFNNRSLHAATREVPVHCSKERAFHSEDPGDPKFKKKKKKKI